MKKKISNFNAFLFSSLLLVAACAPSLEEGAAISSLIQSLSSSSWELSAASHTQLYGTQPAAANVLRDGLTLMSSTGRTGIAWIEKDIQIGTTTTREFFFLDYEVTTKTIKLGMRFIPEEDSTVPVPFEIKGNQLIINGHPSATVLFNSSMPYVYDQVAVKPTPLVSDITQNTVWGLVRKEMANPSTLVPTSPLIVSIQFIIDGSGTRYFNRLLSKTSTNAKYCNDQSYTLDAANKTLTIVNSDPSRCGQTAGWTQTAQDTQLELPFGTYTYELSNNTLSLKDAQGSTYVFELASFSLPL